MVKSLKQLYNDIRSGKKYVHPPVLPTKKVKTLVDVYVEAVNDSVTVLGKKEEQPIERVGQVDIDYYNRLKKIVKAKEGGLEDLIHKLLNISGWSPNKIKNYETVAFKPTYSAFIEAGISVETVTTIINLKESNSPVLNILDDDLRSGDIFNTKQSISRVLNQINDDGDYNKLIDLLWQVRPAVGGSNVGPAEACYTLLTNAKKGKKGDLYLDNIGEVELKSNNALIGSTDGIGVGHTPKDLLNLLNDKKKHIQTAFEFRKASNIYNIEYRKLNKNINNIKNELTKKREKLQLRIGPVLDFILKIIENIDNITRHDPIIINKIHQLDMILKSNAGITFAGKNHIVNDLLKLYNKRIKQLELQANYDNPNFSNQDIEEFMDWYKKTEKSPISFQKVIEFFFHNDWSLSDDEMTEALYATRNFELGSNNEQLKQQIHGIVKDYGDKIITDFELLKKIILAIHMYCYQQNHKFHYILIVNDKTKNAIAINFSEIDGLLPNILNQLIKNNITTGLSPGGRAPFPGTNVLFKGE